jgi:hypothetical protein
VPTPPLAVRIPDHLHGPVTMMLDGPMGSDHCEQLLRLPPSPMEMRSLVLMLARSTWRLVRWRSACATLQSGWRWLQSSEAASALVR